MATDFLLNIFNKSGENKYLKIIQYPPRLAEVIYTALTNIPNAVTRSNINSLLAVASNKNYIRLFSQECSESCLMNNITACFYDTGTIDILLGEQTLVLQVINPVTKIASQAQDRVFTNRVVLEEGEKYAFSKPFGAYVLCVKSPSDISLRYNPVPRPEMTQTLNRDRKSKYLTLIANGCLENKIRDPVCSCINLENRTSSKVDTEFCMNEILGNSETRQAIKRLDATAYGQIFKICDCSNVKCSGGDKRHPFQVAWRLPSNDVNEVCPSNLAIAICNTQFNAGRDATFTGNMDLAQNCSNYIAGNPEVKPSSGGPISEDDGTGGEVTAPPEGGNGGGGAATNNKIYFIVGGIVLVVVILIIVVLLVLLRR